MSDHYFLALHVPEKISRCLASGADRVRRECSYRYWTYPDDYHMTLFFFGQTPPGKLEIICHSMDRLARKTAPFRIAVSTIGGFGEKTHPRVIYAGLSPSAELFGLRGNAAQMLSDRDFLLEDRPFHPHITLAKRWLSGTFTGSTGGEKEMHGLSWHAVHMTLFTVRPGELPRYFPVRHFPFQGR